MTTFRYANQTIADVLADAIPGADGESYVRCDTPQGPVVVRLHRVWKDSGILHVSGDVVGIVDWCVEA